MKLLITSDIIFNSSLLTIIQLIINDVHRIKNSKPEPSEPRLENV